MADESTTPPSFGDISSKADDLFNSGFNYGFYGLSCTTRTKKDQEFSADLKKDVDTMEVSGTLASTLLHSKDYGLIVKQTWSTENTLTTEASLESPLNFENLTLGVENSYQPNSKVQSTSLKSSFANENFNVEANYDIAEKMANLSSVFGIEGYFLGFQMDYDVGKKELGDYSLAMGVDNDDITSHVAVTNLQDVNLTMYRKVNEEIETGAFVNYSKENGNEFGMGAKYVPHEDTAFSAKVNNSAELGLAFQQVIRPGIKLTLSTLIQSKNFHAGGHKVGVGLELNP